VDGIDAADGSRRARIRVNDNGCGMDDALRRRIFEPFFTTKPPGKGTGLGLSVVHGIVTQLGGTISVRSGEGDGSTFEMSFPEATGAAQAGPPADSPQRLGGGRHVLYLDDEEPLVYLAERMLGSQGFRVSGFTRPEDALAAIRNDPAVFDLVVTDYNMPRVSGLQVAAEIRTIAPKLPVMMTSGYITDELREKAALVGVRHLVEKPDTIDGLCDGVVTALDDAGKR
jgi:two-component system cell cycle sensor histidine kinase/response regulator CckA